MAKAASKTAAKSRRTSGGGDGFSRSTAQQFFNRRLEELGGVALFVLAALIVLALLSNGPADPSLNNASNFEPTNALGIIGASFADLALQIMGIGAIGISVILAAWGWRIASHQGLPFFWANALATFPAMLCLCLALAVLPSPESWPYRVSLGGLTGDGLLSIFQSLGDLVGIGVVAPFIALGVALIIGTGSFALCLGISRAEWLYSARWFIFAMQWVAWAATLVFHKVAAVVRPLLERGEAGEKPAVTVAPRRKRMPPKVATKDDDGADERVATPPAPPPTAPEAKRRVTPKSAPPKTSKRAQAERQATLALDPNQDGFTLPPLSILHDADPSQRQHRQNDAALEQNARMLEGVLDDFGVRGEITQVRAGPVVTLYELTPAAGIKSSRVIGLADDIARSMSAISARVAVVPGKNAIGIELPNATRETVYLSELLSSADFDDRKANLNLALGHDIGGSPVTADLARMPHLLISGTTGSGKSVGVNTMILSLLYRLTPEQCRFIMIDPKMLELSIYDEIPHLLSPVVTDPKKAVVALKWAVREMEDRYRKMSKLGVRNITNYNQRVAEAQANGEMLRRAVQTGFDDEGKPVFEYEELPYESMPFIVVIVDEMADLMMVAGKEVEGSIQRLAQMARAAGIHLIMATQRPSVDVITGTIKANFPTRISFQVTSKIDSRTILGEQGAEQLLGMGDMLYMAGGGRITRVHGPFVSDEEVEEVVNFLKAQGVPDYLEDVTEDVDGEIDAILGGDGGGGNSGDDLFDQAVAIVARDRKASTSYIQRKLQIGYNRAANLIERMEQEGMISSANHAGKREIFLPEHNN